MNETVNRLLQQINEIYLVHKAEHIEHWESVQKEAIKRDFSWSHWYEVSIYVMNSIMIRVSGIDKAFAALNNKTVVEWFDAFQSNLMNAEPDYSELSSDPEEGQKIFAELIIAMQYNQMAQEQRNKSISEMVASINNASPRSKELVLEVISVDPTALRNKTIAKFINLAAIDGDVQFLSKISKALLKKSPRPRDQKFDHLRMMMTFIAELEGKENPSLRAMAESNDSLKLVEETSDTVEALRHHIKVRRKDRRSK